MGWRFVVGRSRCSSISVPCWATSSHYSSVRNLSKGGYGDCLSDWYPYPFQLHIDKVVMFPIGVFINMAKGDWDDGLGFKEVVVLVEGIGNMFLGV